MCQVIAVTGMMGRGKSTMIEHLQGMLVDCTALFEDDFNMAPLKSLPEIQAWWNRGGHVEEFDLSPLVQQLQQHAAQSPAESSAGSPLVLLETQFGRLHPQLGPWIDFQCWIEVPSDIAFARKVGQLSRQFLNEPQPADSGNPLQWIAGFCDGYLNTTRQLFERQRQQLSQEADVVVDGQGDPFDVCDRVWQALPVSFKTAA